MSHLTTLYELKQHVTLLASVEESDAPFISCYLNLEDEPDSWRKTLDDRADILRRLLKGHKLADFEEALGKKASRPLQYRLGRLVRAPRFESLIVEPILVNAAILRLETDAALVARYSARFEPGHNLILKNSTSTARASAGCVSSYASISGWVPTSRKSRSRNVNETFQNIWRIMQ